MDEGNGWTQGEVRRWLQRNDLRWDRHEGEHVSRTEHLALVKELEDMKEAQRWWRRLLATQALVTLGALIVLAISLALTQSP